VVSTAEDKDRRISLRFERGQSIREMFEINRESLDALDRALKHTNRNYFTVGYGVSRRIPATASTLSRPR
jgi:fructoselysine-6-P-deglycase FrlB-like protein